MKDETPKCQILIPAPWQRRQRVLEQRLDTSEISVEELIDLVWSIEEGQTPVSDVSETLSETMRDVEEY